MKIYLSGGMRSGWQNKFISLCPKSWRFFDPRNHKRILPKEYTAADLSMIRRSDFVFAYLEKDNPSGIGLALEIGYAIGIGKTVVFVNEKREEKFSICGCAADFICKDMNHAAQLISCLSYVDLRETSYDKRRNCY